MNRRSDTVRRRHGRLGAALSPLAAWLGVLFAAGCGGDAGPPNVLLVTIDTCRADHLGPYSERVSWTPALDALAARGVTFDQATAPVPLTLPSHCSILTGLYPDRHGVRDNGAGRLPDEAESLAETLRDAGWTTAAFLAAVPLERRYGTAQGFDHYDDALVDEPVGGDLLNKLYSNQRTAGEVVDAALAWIRAAAAEPAPYFAWVHLFDPHTPLAPPEPYRSQFASNLYDGEIAYVDAELGRLFAAVDAQERDTWIVLTADHGESLGEHEESSHGWFVYEASMNVPWILAGEGLPAGRRVSEPVSLVHVAPTILEWLGRPAPENLDGRSVLALARGEADEPPEDRVYLESLFPRLNFGWAGSRAIRIGDWKYVDAPEPELYDLAADPGELRNLAAAEPQRVADLRAELADFLDRGGQLEAIALDIDEETRAQLDALGYVGGDGARDGEDLWDFDARDPKATIGIYHELQQLPTIVMSGDLAAEREFVSKLIAQDPGNVAILERTLALRKNNADVDGVIDICRRIVAADPARAEAWITWAEALGRRNDREGAADLLREGAAAAPASPELAERLAATLEALGRTNEARPEYARALALDPARPQASLALARLLTRAGRTREAVATLEEALEHAPKQLDLLNNLAWSLANENLDPARAYDLALRARTLAPDDPVVLDTLGWAAIRAGEPERAIPALRRALELTGDDEVRAHLGIALAEAGQKDEGVSLVRAAAAARPSLLEIPEVARWVR